MTFRGLHKKQQGNRFIHLPEVKEPLSLMDFLIKSYPEKSRSSIKSLLVHNQILVNQSKTSKYDHPLQPGDQVSIMKGKVPEKVELAGMSIIFEDEYLIVIEKEAGLLSVSTSEEKERTAYHMLSSYIKNDNPHGHIFVLHRLDRETSGVMMFAKNQEVQNTMQNNWREMVQERTYTVIVEGKVEKLEGTITSRLIESKAFKIHTTQKPDEGQLAVTHYKLITQGKEYAMLEVTLETGRKNQIRVHMQELGNPVVGDKKYGAHSNPLQRLGLHASLLIFKHPITRETLRFESPLPKSFSRIIKQESNSSQ